ncbi:MAG: type II toxin-antitoxin system RelE/ParE family toxin [Candidatus Binataceae bacterium]
MNVRWLRTALRNLDQAAAYIARDDPQAAAQFIELVMASVNRLITHPDSGRPGRVSGTRELVISGAPYIVPYRVKGEMVEILRVFHGARKWPENI